MTARYLVLGTLPPDSLAGQLAGRTIRLPAATPTELERRVAEAYRAGARPHATLTVTTQGG